MSWFFCFYFCRIERGHEEANLPPKEFEFEVRVETDERQIFRQIQKKLQAYREERKGPTILIIQSLIGTYFVIQV